MKKKNNTLTRTQLVEDWIKKNKRKLTDKQKIKLYPIWIKIIQHKEPTLADVLETELILLKSREKSFFKIIYSRIIRFFS